MKIGELAKQSGLNASTIRFYEKKGLLPQAQRLNSGYRSYDERSLRQLQMIKFAQNLGFSLDETFELLADECIDHDQTLQQLESKRNDINELISNLEEKKQSIDILIEQLNYHWDKNECLPNDSLNLIMTKPEGSKN